MYVRASILSYIRLKTYNLINTVDEESTLLPSVPDCGRKNAEITSGRDLFWSLKQFLNIELEMIGQFNFSILLIAIPVAFSMTGK